MTSPKTPCCPQLLLSNKLFLKLESKTSFFVQERGFSTAFGRFLSWSWEETSKRWLNIFANRGSLPSRNYSHSQVTAFMRITLVFKTSSSWIPPLTSLGWLSLYVGMWQSSGISAYRRSWRRRQTSLPESSVCDFIVWGLVFAAQKWPGGLEHSPAKEIIFMVFWAHMTLWFSFIWFGVSSLVSFMDTNDLNISQSKQITCISDVFVFYILQLNWLLIAIVWYYFQMDQMVWGWLKFVQHLLLIDSCCHSLTILVTYFSHACIIIQLYEKYQCQSDNVLKFFFVLQNRLRWTDWMRWMTLVPRAIIWRQEGSAAPAPSLYIMLIGVDCSRLLQAE